MFRFLTAPQPRIRQPDDLSRVDATYLLFTAFPGDLEVRRGQLVLQSNLQWVPLLNLAVVLPEAVERSLKFGSGVYEMTENDDKIEFATIADVTQVSASFASVTIDAPSSVVRDSVQRFSRQAREFALSSHPELAQNLDFSSLWSSA